MLEKRSELVVCLENEASTSGRVTKSSPKKQNADTLSGNVAQYE